MRRREMILKRYAPRILTLNSQQELVQRHLSNMDDVLPPENGRLFRYGDLRPAQLHFGVTSPQNGRTAPPEQGALLHIVTSHSHLHRLCKNVRIFIYCNILLSSYHV